MLKKLSVIFLAVLLLSLGGLYAETSDSVSKQFTVLEKTSSYMDISFKLDDYQIIKKKYSGTEYTHIIHQTSAYLIEKGLPEIPYFTVTIAVPANGSININSSTIKEDRLTNIVPFPSQGMEKDVNTEPLIVQSSYYNRSAATYPADIASAGSAYQLRDYRLVDIQVYPFSYNPSGNELNIKKEITIRVNYDNDAQVSSYKMNQKISRSFEPMYRSLILNYDQIRDVAPVYQKRTILLIHTTNTTDIQTTLNQFVEWKKQKGFNVVTASLGVTGSTNTAIKNYIQTAYNTWEDKPEYVILLGDAGGTYNIPTFGSYDTGDYSYTWVAGGDNVGDLSIGRISIESASHFATIFSKIKNYEKIPYMATTDWYNKALLVGDPAHSGTSCISVNKYIKNLLLTYQPNFTFTEQYETINNNTSDTALNNGCVFYNYRGYIGMSGWGDSNINGLTNGFKLANYVILTCGTGNYADGTATTETAIRAGTPGTPKGAVTAIGLATSGTHTAFNNFLTMGIFDGLYVANLRTMGDALMYSKIRFSQVFGSANPSQYDFFSRICNLMGDPSMDVWMDIPKQMTVSYQSNVNLGNNNTNFTALNANSEPMKDVWISLYQNGIQINSGYTNEAGTLNLSYSGDLTGAITVTCTKPDFKPEIGTIQISETGTVAYQSAVIDDDNTGGSTGNSNGVVNAGETIQYNVTLKNYNAQAFESVQAKLSLADPNVTMIDSLVTFGNMASNQTIQGATPFKFTVSGNCQDKYNLAFILTVTSGDQSWTNRIDVPVAGVDLDITGYDVMDNGNHVLDTGETTNLGLGLKNNGQNVITNVYAILRSQSTLVDIQDSVAYFGTLNVGAQVSSTEHFIVTALGQTIPGMTIPFEVTLYNNEGYSEVENFGVMIGMVGGPTAVFNPTGPDAYGYLCYDDGDSTYLDHPEYDWINVVSLGGTLLPLNDHSDNTDDIVDVTLPFNFKFYGLEYNNISVCSNGWLGLGHMDNYDFRNGTIPGSGCPHPFIAAFWDDLYASGTESGVYTYFNQDEHYYVIQWNNMKNNCNPSYIETFQIILYDQTYFPTSTDDGIIKIQYQTFNNVDTNSDGSTTHHSYSTIGILDHTGTRGIQYSYNNVYPVTAKTLTNGSAILFSGTPINHELPYLILSANPNIFDANGNHVIESGETVDLGISLTNIGQQDADSTVAVLSTTDPNITILNSTSEYNTIISGYSGTNIDYYTFQVAPNCPDNHTIPFVLTVTNGDNTWERRFSVNSRKPTYMLGSVMINDIQGNGNGMPDPNEDIQLVVNILNPTNMPIENLRIQLTIAGDLLVLNENNKYFGTIPAFTTVQKAYSAHVSGNAQPNQTVLINVMGFSNNAFDLDTSVNIGIGVQTDILNEPFNTFLPMQWTIDNNVANWTSSQTSNAGGMYPEVKFSGQPSFDGTTRLVSKPFNLSGATNAVLGFKEKYIPGGGSTGTIGVAYRSNTSPWTTIWSAPAGGTSGPMLQYVSLNDVNQFNYQLCWYYAGFSGGSTWYIDDVTINAEIANTAKISGTITTSNNVQDLHNALITLGNYSALADTNGYYEMYVPAGTYPAMTIKMAGYELFSVANVVVTSGQVLDNQNANLQYLIPVENLRIASHNNENYTIAWDYANRPDFECFKIYKQKDASIYVLKDTTSSTTYIDELQMGSKYHYYVTAKYSTGESLISNILIINLADSLGNNNPAVNGYVTRLNPNYPNPFNPTTTISYSLSKSQKVKINVYNVKGQLVKALVNGQQNMGRNTVVWNGKTDKNKPAGSGIYFIKMEAENQRFIRKALLLK